MNKKNFNKSQYFKDLAYQKKMDERARNPKKTFLSSFDLKSFTDELKIRAQFSYLRQSTVEWIIEKRFELISSANRYEHILGACLGGYGIEFVHQAPFYIGGRIYFLDFFIPSKRIAIEVDGDSHKSIESQKRDKIRDLDFKSIGIKTVRLPNKVVQSKDALKIHLNLNGITDTVNRRLMKIIHDGTSKVETEQTVDQELELSSNLSYKKS